MKPLDKRTPSPLTSRVSKFLSHESDEAEELSMMALNTSLLEVPLIRHAGGIFDTTLIVGDGNITSVLPHYYLIYCCISTPDNTTLLSRRMGSNTERFSDVKRQTLRSRSNEIDFYHCITRADTEAT
jgi:hypothetical protein